MMREVAVLCPSALGCNVGGDGQGWLHRDAERQTGEGPMRDPYRDGLLSEGYPVAEKTGGVGIELAEASVSAANEIRRDGAIRHGNADGLALRSEAQSIALMEEVPSKGCRYAPSQWRSGLSRSLAWRVPLIYTTNIFTISLAGRSPTCRTRACKVMAQLGDAILTLKEPVSSDRSSKS